MGVDILHKLSIWLLPVLFAITVHEVAHGWVALQLGDPTAKMLGRLTLNPIKHIDPIGTVLLPIFLMFTTNFIFGWAKPVPVTWQNLKRPRLDMLWVAAAGPIANLGMAILWGLVAKLGFTTLVSVGSTGWAKFAFATGRAGIIINVVLMVLNLLPIPPLDGSKVASALLPGRWAYHYHRIEPYGIFIMLGLLVSGILFKIIGPAIQGITIFIFKVLGLPLMF